MGNWPTIYASGDTLLIAEPAQDWWWYWGVEDIKEETNIHAFSLDEEGTSYIGSGRVNGTVLNQFSLSEYDGKIRLATTTGQWNRWWVSDPEPMENHVIVLQPNETTSTLDEIEWAVNYFYDNGGKDISLLHTISKYPAPLSSLNLKIISELEKKFNIPVGFSDHSRSPTIGPITAVSLGGRIIEKHFTLNNNLPGPDHSFALTPIELKNMVEAIRGCELVLGSNEKTILQEEFELREFAHRGIQAIKEIKENDIFKEGENVDILRPGKQKQGIHPKYLEQLSGKKSKRNISQGEGIIQGDW